MVNLYLAARYARKQVIEELNWIEFNAIDAREIARERRFSLLLFFLFSSPHSLVSELLNFVSFRYLSLGLDWIVLYYS